MGSLQRIKRQIASDTRGGGGRFFLEMVDMHSSFHIVAVHSRKPFQIDLPCTLPRLLLFVSRLQRQYHIVSETNEYLMPARGEGGLLIQHFFKGEP